MDGSISLVLRSTEDCKPVEEPSPRRLAERQPVAAASAAAALAVPDLHDHGRHPSQADRRLGVIPPQVVEVIQPTPYPQFAP